MTAKRKPTAVELVSADLDDRAARGVPLFDDMRCAECGDPLEVYAVGPRDERRFNRPTLNVCRICTPRSAVRR